MTIERSTSKELVTERRAELAIVDESSTTRDLIAERRAKLAAREVTKYTFCAEVAIAAAAGRDESQPLAERADARGFDSVEGVRAVLSDHEQALADRFSPLLDTLITAIHEDYNDGMWGA